MYNFEIYKTDKYSKFSEIQLHLPILESYSQFCETVTEFGVREANSTVAFLSGAKKKVTSYDIDRSEAVDILQGMKLPCEWEFKLQSSSDLFHSIDETDMLFVDSDHSYDQVKTELMLHGDKAKKFIGFHDTEKYGVKSYCGVGINLAIYEFIVRSDKFWDIEYYSKESNGLLILSCSNTNNLSNIFDVLRIKDIIIDFGIL